MRVAGALLLAGGIALAARRFGALSRGGALAAWATGSIIFAAGGIRYTAVLLSFFVSSSALSRLHGRHESRNAAQVGANGGIAALCAVLAAMTKSQAASAAFAGACAAAAADTWGTEIGTLSAVPPRSILSFERIDAGLSGGVTAAGMLAQCAGALLVAGTADFAGVASWKPVSLAGVCGALIDSILGAGLQELRYCDRCRRQCERDVHACGSPTRRVRGYAWLRNDAVNALATLSGAAIASALRL